MDDIKQFNEKFVAFILLTAMMIVFIPSTSSKYVKEFPIDFNLSTKLAQFKIIWTDQTGSNAPSSQLVSKGDIGFSTEGYYLLVAKGGNGGSITGPDDNEYAGGYGGIVGGIFKINPANVTLEVALGTSASGKTAGANSKGCLLGGNSSADATVGGSTGGGAGTMLLVQNDSYNSTSDNNTAMVNNLVLLGAGGGGSGALTSMAVGFQGYGFLGGAGGSNFINATTQNNRTLAISTFAEYYGNAGAGTEGVYGAAGTYQSAYENRISGIRNGTKLGVGLTQGYGGIDSDLGAGGGGGLGGGSAAETYAGGAGGGSSAINTTSSITNVEYQSSYSASRVLELYKEKMAEIMSLDTTVNSSGKKLSDLCVLGNEGYLYRKDDETKYSDISFVAIYYLGSTAPF